MTRDPRRYRVDAAAVHDAFDGTALEDCVDSLLAAVDTVGASLVHGDLPLWRAALDSLPDAAGARVALEPWPAMASDASLRDVAAAAAAVGSGASGAASAASSPGNDAVVAVTFGEDAQCRASADPASLTDALMSLRPWRKGPFRFGDVLVDTEWRSDLKWDRIRPALRPLAGRSVLDVGTGSGYHLWRMRAEGASAVLGIEPLPLYNLQFEAVARYARAHSATEARALPVQCLPLTLEALPADLERFDTVFSMGVLYHRRDPAAHLAELRGALTGEGELLLETLVAGDGDDVLEPDGRYARMRNIRVLPGIARLLRWLEDAGFTSIRTVSIDQTTTDEQRRTRWMPQDSLAEALDPERPDLSVEGHPRPRRVAVVARAV